MCALIFILKSSRFFKDNFCGKCFLIFQLKDIKIKHKINLLMAESTDLLQVRSCTRTSLKTRRLGHTGKFYY